jgi:hypothetical protein
VDGTTTINVVRGGQTVLTGITAQIDPVDPTPFNVAQVAAGAAGDTPFDRYEIFPLTPTLPDIRMRDQVVDTDDIDPLTGTNSTYYVRRVKVYKGSHIEIEADRVAARHTT